MRRLMGSTSGGQEALVVANSLFLHQQEVLTEQMPGRQTLRMSHVGTGAG